MQQFNLKKDLTPDIHLDPVENFKLDSLALLKNNLEAQAAFFSDLTRHIHQIDFQKKLIELLWVTSSNGPLDEFKKCLDQVLADFNFLDGFLSVYCQVSGKFHMAYEFHGTGKTPNGPDYIFDKDLAGLTFLETEGGTREHRREAFIEGNFVVLPGITENKLLGCLVLGLPSGGSDLVLIDELKNGTGNCGFLKKAAAAMCTWALQNKNFSRNTGPSFESKMSFMGVSLNSKQRRILELVASGESNKEIANTVHLSEQAVKYHVGNLLEKFSVTNRTELRTKVIQMNFVPHSI